MTRFYLQSTGTPPNTPGFGAWDRTTEAIRRPMVAPRVSTAMTSFTIWANGNVAASDDALCGQFHSRPIKVGTVFATTATIKCQMRCQESGTNDNINRQPIRVAIYNGNTLQATLVGLAHVGPNTNEWLNTGLRNKIVADGDTLTGLGGNYTTVSGDYLVVELGGQVSTAGGTSVTGTISIGSDNASDLGENETDTTALNPWFEISTTVLFDTPVNAESGSYSITGAEATLLEGHLLDAASGSYTISGAAATLVKGKALDAAPGSYSLTGSEATLLESQLLDATAGSYSITGSEATLSRGRLLDAAPGSYSLTGSEANLLEAHLLDAGPGSYAIAGADATLLEAQTLDAAPGSYTLSGSEATLLEGQLIVAEPGAYTITGASADLTEGGGSGVTMVAGSGSYGITGHAAEMGGAMVGQGAGVSREIWLDLRARQLRHKRKRQEKEIEELGELGEL